MKNNSVLDISLILVSVVPIWFFHDIKNLNTGVVLILSSYIFLFFIIYILINKVKKKKERKIINLIFFFYSNFLWNR